ncbi:hypothetical protein WHR41_02007 [Cladosporium halotolerans]|uniref:very-long-chain enoyl-CoA reductase n=1 Tax=Cladosporium halotolerans TaxID=1052096 RepID=A0AB34KVX8_9PEZI
MASKPVTLKVQPRGKPIPGLPKETKIYIQGSTADLYQRIAADSKSSVHRLRITQGKGTAIPNDKSVTVASTELQDGDVIQVKDLGPQIAWRTVFIIEYLGPLLIHPIFYYLRPYIYTLPTFNPGPSSLQTISFWMITLHFLKRELETIFVHRFSLATMPYTNIFKNSAHYWLFSGVLIAYFTYSPNSPTASSDASPALTYVAVALYIIGELCNLSTHLTLRSLRAPGSTERGIPRGLGFDWVTCPNYLFESIAWVAILLVNRHWSTAIFIALAVGQMAIWAKKKERRYRKELGGKYKKKRFAMVPGIW